MRKKPHPAAIRAEKKSREQAALIRQLQRQYNGMSAYAGDLLAKIDDLKRLNSQQADVIRLLKQATGITPSAVQCE